MSLTELLRRNIVLDSCGAKKDKKDKKDKPVLDDAANNAAQLYTLQDLKLKAASAIKTWCETDDLGSDETSADRLQALFIGIVDANKDGEINPEESDVLDTLLNYAWDYFSENGVDDDDIDALLNGWESDAADRVMDLLNGTLSDGDEDLNKFAFGTDQETVFDGVFKKVLAIKNGIKQFIHKRISGRARLSAKQKIAIRKMHMKSHTASAMMHRMKSMRLRKRSGL